MRLPEGATMEPATMEALLAIFSDPRPLELDTWRTLGITPEELAAKIMEATHPVVVRHHGVPAMYFSRHVTQSEQGHPVVIYGAAGTPILDRYPVAYTRCGRDLVRASILQYPDRLHLTVADPNGFARLWLHRLGFRDTDQFSELPGGRLLWLAAHIPEITAE